MQSIISIVVATYNQAHLIEETLDSIRLQSSDRYEIVITDDCSTDDTVRVCEKWVARNQFANKAKIIKSPANTGPAANLNRGVANSCGSHIKPLAGDDLLSVDAIEEFIKIAETYSRYEIVISNLHLFPTENRELPRLRKEYDLYFEKCKLSHAAHKKLILKELFIPGPGVFFSRKLFDKVGGFDETYPFLEEWPFFLKVIDHGYDIAYIDKQLVHYRVQQSSLGRVYTEKRRLPNGRVYADVVRYFYDYRLWRMIKRGMFLDSIKQAIVYELTKRRITNWQKKQK